MNCLRDANKTTDQILDCLKNVKQPPEYMQPVLGNLVILINPAAEASKWISIQEAIWQRLAVSTPERYTMSEYENSHTFFQPSQVPLIISVTAARDWPPGGLFETDCYSTKAKLEQDAVANEGFEYDSATYDLFPAFKGDFRPIADTLERFAWGTDPHNPCDTTQVSAWRRVLGYPIVKIADFLRLLPFQQTDPEQSHTIGNIDPPRVPYGALTHDSFSARPFGATHELRGINPNSKRTTERKTDKTGREVPLLYLEVLNHEAHCPVADSWLLRARQQQLKLDPTGHGTGWESSEAGDSAPALGFIQGFCDGGLAPITRANDPFWNMRAFNSAVARHDGYKLASFICAMNQMVMDDVGGLSPAAESDASTSFGKKECVN
jgi:hypothetical protein